MVISPSLNACGNSSCRNFSSSATLIFATAIRPCPRFTMPVTLRCHISPNENLRPETLEMPAQTVRAPTSQPQVLLQENIGSIRLLTLNRPAARNSLSEALIAGLHGALNEIRDDSSVRGVV